jgi:RsiW-degrading membrane proteinase PrsW (M82 family)
MDLPDPERSRRTVGLVLYVVAVLLGTALLVLEFLLPPLFMEGTGDVYVAMFIGAALAFPAGLMYLTVPRLLDRYDPEPAYALVACLMWGGIVACAFSAFINSLAAGVGLMMFGEGGADILSAVVSAPLVEEFWKGLCIWGVFWFLRREFDGVVDGIIYATFTALGFATVENVLYYSQAAQEGGDVLALTFVLRGVLGPWGHPLYTAMTGIGFGIARESSKTWVKIVAPLCGYSGAVFLHFAWNGSATLADSLGEGGAMLFILLLPLWLLFVVAFLIIVVVLVRRRGRIIRSHLLDEVALGTIDASELELVTSAFGLLRARMRHGARGVEFVRATARLALSKWHATRAYEGQVRTVSVDFILPLRAKIRELKASLVR